MLPNSYIIITISLLPFLRSALLSSTSLLTLLATAMSLNPMTHHHPQAWYWEQSMVPFNQGHPHSYWEYMFEKPLTPSDVGKLNRLVIPKQHAERHFPLYGDSCEKGLLLCFEDESGKSWHFRYSYWTSSQSYVLTKGWSRFVKEKRLDAGDVVFFQRLRAGGDRLYIGCRRRGANESAPPSRAAAPWGSTCYDTVCPYPISPSCPSCVCPNSAKQHQCHHAGKQRDGDAESVAMVAPTNSKRLRLFGVNLDCCPDPEPQL